MCRRKRVIDGVLPVVGAASGFVLVAGRVDRRDRQMAAGVAPLPEAPPAHELQPARPAVEAEPVQVAGEESIAFLRKGDLWLMRPDGSGQRRLTVTFSEHMGMGEIEWFEPSPDGKYIAFRRHNALWVMNADGSKPERLVGDEIDARSGVRWSPDSRGLVFWGWVHRRAGKKEWDERCVWYVSRDAKETRKLKELPEGIVPGSVSPDGRFYLYLRSKITKQAEVPPDWEKRHPAAELPSDYTSDDSLWLADLQTGKARKIAEQKGNEWEPSVNPEENGFDACFSADSRYVAYGTGFVWSRGREGEKGSVIAIAPTAGGRTRILKDRKHTRECWDFHWSPSGRKLLGVYGQGFVVVDVATNTWTYLKTGAAPGYLGAMAPGESAGSWAVSPDGTRIVFVVSSGPNFACFIKVMDADGTNRRTLASPDDVMQIQWMRGKLHTVTSYGDIWIDGQKWTAGAAASSPGPELIGRVVIAGCDTIASWLGLESSKDSGTRSVTLNGYGKRMVLTAGKDAALLDGKTIPLGGGATLVGDDVGRLRVAVRPVAEGFGGSVRFDPLTERTYVYSPKVLAAARPPDWLTRELTEAELKDKSAAQLRMMRNEICAHRGREFQDPELRHHFFCQPWYRPDPKYTDALLKEVDRANIALIRKVESEAAGGHRQ